MKTECLPFSQIPHTTQLFSDFLSYSPKVRRFYPRSPHFSEWLKQETAAIRYNNSRRQRVAEILERQNKTWGGTGKTSENIARFRNGALVAVTGQQVGLFGGPLFSIFKALTAVKLADQATAAGIDCVPVFWLATEDHDLAEVNNTSLPTAEGSLEKLITPTQGLPDAPVGAVQFGEEIKAVVETASRLLGISETTELLVNSYRPGETLGSAFARLFTRLFADWGVILLDAGDPALHRITEPIYRAAVERAAEIDEALLKRGRELESAGYHQQVKVTPSSTLLFTLHNGGRVPVHRRPNGSSEPDFVIEDKKIPHTELLHLIASAPHHFSANVLLRPVVQDYLLPTLAYTGGSAEVAYFAQAAVVYQALLGRVTPILPRFSATLVEPKPQRLLERYGLKLTDLFHGPESLREILAARTLPADLQSAFDQASASLDQSLSAIRESFSRLDATLVDAASRAGSKMQYQLEHLRTSAARAELRQSEILNRHAEQLSNALYPGKSLQEREVAGVYLLARYGRELLHQLYGTIHTECLDHQLVSLQS
ncbi:MAG TPA: bacillithiol biosynthesis cysteine-adding enzyme BshC [Terriglobales bacterium]|nr:bacillithiol biosynthesis cysteine-adding enzyme BshC [Terriglobales bacterium]